MEQTWDRSSGNLLTANFEVSAETPCEKDRRGIALLEWVLVQTGPVRDTSRDRKPSEVDYVANFGSLQTRPCITLVSGDFWPAVVRPASVAA